MRLVFDTAMMVAALRSDAGASRQLLIAALERRVTVIVSVPLMIEYEAVLTRPDPLLMSGLSADEIGVLLDTMAAVVEPVRLTFLWRPMLRDPDDDMVLETAFNGRATAIVTFNVRDFAVAEARFGVKILRPGQVLNRLGGTS